ncbi:hypothetical protein K438DRAFT_1955220 [Mycena galopus ATCC 62051]|nr:hypothetical protein K438DRAFT_1955220 [Mycena galopus ATCC 62051]
MLCLSFEEKIEIRSPGEVKRKKSGDHGTLDTAFCRQPSFHHDFHFAPEYPLHPEAYKTVYRTRQWNTLAPLCQDNGFYVGEMMSYDLDHAAHKADTSNFFSLFAAFCDVSCASTSTQALEGSRRPSRSKTASRFSRVIVAQSSWSTTLYGN